MKITKPTRKRPRQKPTPNTGRRKRVAKSRVNSEVTAPQRSSSSSQQDEDEPDIPDFKHEPLDHSKPFIRLLRVLPTFSAGGLLQCRLTSNKEIASSIYICLSYMWGDDPPSRWIIINEKKFAIRENLWAFLNVARSKYTQAALWIDALCIDQDSVKERNHQVEQMGEIYSAARNAVVWLGDSKPLARLFQSLAAVDTLSVDIVRELRELRTDWRLLADHKYWTRAWIIQELALPKDCSLLAADTVFDASRLYELYEKANLPESHNRRLRSILKLNLRTQRLGKLSLISLLVAVPDQACAIRRDRVYSLLSLAVEGKHITVDYGISDEDFFFSLVKTCASSMCLCSIHLIARVLGFEGFEPHKPIYSPIPIAETVIVSQEYLFPPKKGCSSPPVIFNAKDICELFSGRFYVDHSEIVCIPAAQRSPKLLSTNGDLSSRRSGIGLEPCATGGYTFRINLSTLVQFPIFAKKLDSRSLCSNAKWSVECFRILEESN